MLFVIFGWPRRTKEYGPTYPMHCNHCDNDSFHHLVKERRWFSLYFIPVLPLGRANFYLLCEVCGTGFEMSKPAYKAAKTLSKSTNQYVDGQLSENEYEDELRTFEATLETFEPDGELEEGTGSNDFGPSNQ